MAAPLKGGYHLCWAYKGGGNGCMYRFSNQVSRMKQSPVTYLPIRINYPDTLEILAMVLFKACCGATQF